MLHGQKMVLIPQDAIKQLKEDVPKAPAHVGSFSKMDSDMESILRDSTLGDFDKWVQYDMVLQRYMSKLNRQNRDLKFHIIDEFENDHLEPVHKKPDEVENVKIKVEEAPLKLEDYSQKFEPDYGSTAKNVKALMLYNILKKSANVEISDDGNLSVYGQHIGSIKSLIDSSVAYSVPIKPTGWSDFQAFLKKIGLPVGYVNNKELKNYLKTSASFAVRSTRKSKVPLKWSPYNGASK
jgi:hypothetical protein